MTVTPLSPTVWLVHSDKTLQCNRAGCGYSAAVTKSRTVGSQCPECDKAGKQGSLYLATYTVDLEAYTQNSKCDCHHFRCTLEPIVKNMTPTERRLERGRCRHIELVREQAKQDDNFDNILAMLPQQEDQK